MFTPTRALLEELRVAALEDFEASGKKWVDNWFSNMRPFEKPLTYGLQRYGAPENFYQAMKSRDENYRAKVARATPQKAKKLGREVDLRPDWNQVRTEIMLFALRWKFSERTHAGLLLLETGDMPIIEWNNWGDLLWGVSIYTGRGFNLLGQLLELRRTELRYSQYPLTPGPADFGR